jgi:outer membrane protein assembly factor BamB
MSYDGATLYVGNEAGTLYAINLNTLAQKWSLAVGGALKGFVWEDWTTAGRLYFATGANQVRCVLDQTTSGSIQWTTAVTAPSTPLTMDTVLYVGSSDGKVHQLLLSNGTDQKQYTVGSGAYQVGDVSTETWNEIFVPTTEGKLYKLTLPLP